ncbi:J domain-containing protein CG6693 [Phlebotomus argentipes]|uniref:J domain-containing protein CG6693 n=1 Tax=Phlebotomus argentipes TaxID=94469 RepID=UPI002892CBE4|nr:J domain-containing protein CG6693 [Phlebotomus argentipes]
MPSTLDLCEEYYGTRDLYKLLDIDKNTLEKDVKKAYYKLSLKVHPDRVAENQKADATEKFKILGKIYAVLSDPDKKKLYEEKGIIDDDEDESKLATWIEMWKTIFKPITDEDIENYQKSYVGSDLEKSDIKKAYMNGNGCINYLMSTVPFMAVEDEPRIIAMVKEWIDAGEVPEYEIFTKEPKAKRNRRHKKYARENLEAEEIKAKLAKEGNSLEKQIMRRQNERAQQYDDLFAKYFVEEKPKKKRASKQASKAAPEEPLRKVKSGRVSKAKK